MASQPVTPLPYPEPLSFTVQFTRNGKPISDATMDAAIVHYAINGYIDVPFRNLWRIATQWPNIAAAKGPSETTIKMLDEIRKQGFDWTHDPKLKKRSSDRLAEQQEKHADKEKKSKHN